MENLKRLFAIDALFFSWSQSFLILNGVVLVVVVPASLSIGNAAATPGLAAFFPQAFTLLLAVYAVNFGQTQADPARAWRKRLGTGLRPHATQLAVRLSMLLFLTLPLWVLFSLVFFLRWPALIALPYLWLQAQLWGGFGLWLNMKGFSEINQFKIKYFVLFAYFGLTLFLPPLNPLITMQLLLNVGGALPSFVHALTAFASTLFLIALVGVSLRAGLLKRTQAPSAKP